MNEKITCQDGGFNVQRLLCPGEGEAPSVVYAAKSSLGLWKWRIQSSSGSSSASRVPRDGVPNGENIRSDWADDEEPNKGDFFGVLGIGATGDREIADIQSPARSSMLPCRRGARAVNTDSDGLGGRRPEDDDVPNK